MLAIWGDVGLGFATSFFDVAHEKHEARGVPICQGINGAAPSIRFKRSDGLLADAADGVC